HRNSSSTEHLSAAVRCTLSVHDAFRSPSPPLPGVEVAEVEQQDVPIHSEWIGTLDGMVNAEIRAQVAGYLRTQRYTEGSFEKKGDRKSTRLNSRHSPTSNASVRYSTIY